MVFVAMYSRGGRANLCRQVADGERGRAVLRRAELLNSNLGSMECLGFELLLGSDGILGLPLVGVVC